MYGLFLVDEVPEAAEVTYSRITLPCGSVWPTEYWAWRHVAATYAMNRDITFALDVQEVDGPRHQPDLRKEDYECADCCEMHARIAQQQKDQLVMR